MSTSRSRLFVLALIVALACVGSASAQTQTFSMSGTWTLQRGPANYIPIIPGFVPGMGTVMAMGSAPATLTVPANVFAETIPGALFPLPQMSLVQLSTMLTASGPEFPGMFFAGPKGSRPANFAWCMGTTPFMGQAMNPNCTNPNPGGGILPGRITYTASATQFGGTMQMLLSGSGVVSLVWANPSANSWNVLHNPFGGAGGMNDQEAGGPFANTGSVMLAAGDITLQTADPHNMIIAPAGTVIGMGPPETNKTVGFPWTTGNVMATNPTMLTFGPGGSMLTLAGMDARTPMGAGNLVMVAGALTRRTVANQSYVHLDVVNLTIDSPEVPSMTLGGFAAAAALLVLTAGYLLRRRLA